MQDWTASTRNGVTRKRSTKRLKDTGCLLRNKPLCLLTLGLKEFRSYVKGNLSVGREF